MLDDAGRRRASSCGCGCVGRSEAAARIVSAQDFEQTFRRAHRARPTSSTPTRIADQSAHRRRAARARARRTPACCGASSSITTSCEDWLDGDPEQPPPPRAAASTAATRLAAPVQSRRHLDARQVGVSVVRGVGPGVSHDPDGARRSASSPRSSCCCSCANGTCTPTGRCRRTSLPSATSTRRCTPGPAGASTR